MQVTSRGAARLLRVTPGMQVAREVVRRRAGGGGGLPPERRWWRRASAGAALSRARRSRCRRLGKPAGRRDREVLGGGAGRGTRRGDTHGRRGDDLVRGWRRRGGAGRRPPARLEEMGEHAREPARAGGGGARAVEVRLRAGGCRRRGAARGLGGGGARPPSGGARSIGVGDDGVALEDVWGGLTGFHM